MDRSSSPLTSTTTYPSTSRASELTSTSRGGATASSEREAKLARERAQLEGLLEGAFGYESIEKGAWVEVSPYLNPSIHPPPPSRFSRRTCEWHADSLAPPPSFSSSPSLLFRICPAAIFQLADEILSAESVTPQQIGLASSFASFRRFAMDENRLLGGGWQAWMVQPRRGDGGKEVLECW